jgi:hypothetical protein
VLLFFGFGARFRESIARACMLRYRSIVPNARAKTLFDRKVFQWSQKASTGSMTAINVNVAAWNGMEFVAALFNKSTCVVVPRRLFRSVPFRDEWNGMLCIHFAHGFVVYMVY